MTHFYRKGVSRETQSLYNEWRPSAIKKSKQLWYKRRRWSEASQQWRAQLNSHRFLNFPLPEIPFESVDEPFKEQSSQEMPQTTIEQVFDPTDLETDVAIDETNGDDIIEIEADAADKVAKSNGNDDYEVIDLSVSPEPELNFVIDKRGAAADEMDIEHVPFVIDKRGDPSLLNKEVEEDGPSCRKVPRHLIELS